MKKGWVLIFVLVAIILIFGYYAFSKNIFNLTGKAVDKVKEKCITYEELIGDGADPLTLTKKINKATDNPCDKDKEKIKEKNKELLKKRKDSLKELMKNSPQMALRVEPLSDKVTRELSPSEKEDLIEKRGKFEGKLNILHIDDFENPENSKFSHFLIKDNKRYELYVAASVIPYPSNSEIVVEGISLDNIVAADSNIALKYVPAGSDAVVNFGNQKTLVIVAGTDKTPAQVTVDKAREIVFGSTNSSKSYYKRNSYGRADLVGDVLGTYTLRESDVCNETQVDPAGYILVESLKAVSSKVNIENYNRIILAFPCTPCLCYGGLGSIGVWYIPNINGKNMNASVSWDFFFNEGVVNHELGHNFGVHHANHYYCLDSKGKQTSYSYECESSEYGDPYDVMGSSYYNGDLNGAHKKEIGWLSKDNVVTTTNGTYNLRKINWIQPPGIPQLIRIPASEDFGIYAGKKDVYYVVDWKEPSRANTDYEIGEGVLVYKAIVPDDGNFTYTQTNLLSMDSGIDLFESYYPLAPKQSFVNKIGGYNITLDKIYINNSISKGIVYVYDLKNKLIMSRSLSSSSSGYYNFASLPTGRYKAIGRSQGYFDSIKEFDVKSNIRTYLNFYLERRDFYKLGPKNGSMRAYVYDNNIKDVILLNSRVYVYDLNNTFKGSGFNFRNLSSGRYIAVATASGYLNSTQEFYVNPNEWVNLSFYLYNSSYALGKTNGSMRAWTYSAYNDSIAQVTIKKIPKQTLPSNKPILYYDFNEEIKDGKQLIDKAGFVSGGSPYGITNRSGAAFFNDHIESVKGEYNEHIKLGTFSGAAIINSNKMTVSFWINAENISDEDSSNDRFIPYKISYSDIIIIHENGQVIFIVPLYDGTYYDSIYLESPSLLRKKTWHHITGVYNGSDAVLYIDGDEQARGRVQSSNQKFYISMGGESSIGKSIEYINSNFKGYIEEYKIYAGALNSSQIKSLYTGFKPQSVSYP